MAGRASLDDKLAAIRALRGQVPTADQRGDLRRWLGDRSNLVVAAAAALAGEHMLNDLATALESAFERFLVNPLKEDKLCRAKLAVVQALDRLEHPRADIFGQAARHVQFEPTWGGSEDSAAPLRAAALVALARVEGSGCLPLLVDSLADPTRDVRIAAAVALGAIGTEAAGLILRLKVRVGDKDPDVLSECLLGLLTVGPRANLAIVAGFLTPSQPIACEAAALALGKSRLLEALDPLRECWPRCFEPELRQHVLLAIAILRRPAAIDHLIEVVATEPDSTATPALTALRIFQDDPRLVERVETVVRDRASPPLRAAFDQHFRRSEV